MELKQLNYFLTVAEHRSFSRAAEALFISQPALSYQIAELERELTVSLFVRDKRKIYLTPEGAALVAPAQELLDKAKEFSGLSKRAAAHEGEHGLLRIGFDATEDHFEFTGVTDTLARFGLAHPGIEFENFHGPFPECADRVLLGDLDLAFLITRYNEHLPPELDGKCVHRGKQVLVVQEDLPARTCEEAVAQNDLILVEEKPRGNSRILRALGDMGLHPHIRMVDSITTGFVYMQMGRGCMLMSQLYYQCHPYKHMRAIDIPSQISTLAHTVVWNKANRTPFVDKLLDEFDDLS